MYPGFLCLKCIENHHLGSWEPRSNMSDSKKSLAKAAIKAGKVPWIMRWLFKVRVLSEEMNLEDLIHIHHFPEVWDGKCSGGKRELF